MNDQKLEIAAVIVVTQASFSLMAGLSALPFAIVEPGYRVLGLLTIAIAAALFWLARNIRRGRQWARRWVMTLQSMSLLATLILLVLPVGAVRGPVPLLVNVVLPVSVIVLLRRRRQADSQQVPTLAGALLKE